MFQINSLFSASVTVSLALLAVSGCSKSTRFTTAAPAPQAAPFAKSTAERATLAVQAPSVNPDVPFTTPKQYSVTFTKTAILNRSFIYNLDLQYSGQYDATMDLYNQSEVVTSVPAAFVIQGSELQLIQDTRYKYPSDVNHPAVLISRFKILSETDTDLVVTDADSTAFLLEQLGPVIAGTPNAKPPGSLDRWTRTAQVAANGTLYLQQTSITTDDGTTSEFMESIFPRETLQPGGQFKELKMNPDDPVGVFPAGAPGPDDSFVGRFRFLNGDTAFTGEDKHAFAQHYDLSPKADGTLATIDWYVTPNAPDEVLPELKLAVEGWNRYFRAMKGIQRDVLSFKGKLPDGIFMGDPRYNVIAWDSRQVAGAAYETQGSDPENGKQSHSLIYMPAAWLKIGTDYWAQGQYSEGSDGDPIPSAAPPEPARTKLSLRSACSRDLRDSTQVATSGRFSQNEVAVFGRELLKQTLFHEVGHSLGFAHNFEGSTEMDLSKPGTLFSSSIMDYNDFEIERAAFSGLESSDGPLLEYDRQTLSAIYNRGVDIASDARKMPACNDAEADNEAGGVIPICIRYDVEHDPTMSVQRAASRITDATIAGDVTLTQALARIPSLYVTDARVAGVKNRDDAEQFVTGFSNALIGSLTYYIGTSRASLGYAVRLNVKSLLELSPTAFPAVNDYDPEMMRERAFAGIQAMTSLLDLPAGVKTALNAARDDGMAKLASCPYMIRMASSTQTEELKRLTAEITLNLSHFVTDSANAKAMPAMRIKVIGALARHTADPFYLGLTATGSPSDYEASLVGVLGDIVTGKDKYTSPERIAAAKSLATYTGRRAFNDATPALAKALGAEQATAADNDSLEAVQSILAALGAS
jgi:hypothetical protein